MKALKIKTTIPTNTGDDVTIPAGAIVVMSEIYLPLKDSKPTGDVPFRVGIDVYSSAKSYGDKKKLINQFLVGTTFPGSQPNQPSADLVIAAEIPAADYTATKAETLFINTVKAELEKVFPNNVDIVNI
jgi:hypothetical protein